MNLWSICRYTNLRNTWNKKHLQYTSMFPCLKKRVLQGGLNTFRMIPGHPGLLGSSITRAYVLGRVSLQLKAKTASRVTEDNVHLCRSHDVFHGGKSLVPIGPMEGLLNVLPKTSRTRVLQTRRSTGKQFDPWFYPESSRIKMGMSLLMFPDRKRKKGQERVQSLSYI